MPVATTEAGSGLSATPALRFVKPSGMAPCLDLGNEAAQGVAAEVGGSAHAVNVSDSAVVEALFHEIEATQGIPRVVVNCADIAAADEYARLAQRIVENPMKNGSLIRIYAAARMPIR